MADTTDPLERSEPVESASSARVKTVACLGGVSLERGVPTEEIHEYIRDAANLVWMDVQDPGPAELSMLLEEFGFHPLALEDVAKGEQRPKVDEYKGHLFVVTYAVASADDSQEVRTPPRQKPDNIQRQVIRRREFKHLELRSEQVAEFEDQPTACPRPYRRVVLRQNISPETDPKN